MGFPSGSLPKVSDCPQRMDKPYLNSTMVTPLSPSP